MQIYISLNRGSGGRKGKETHCELTHSPSGKPNYPNNKAIQSSVSHKTPKVPQVWNHYFLKQHLKNRTPACKHKATTIALSQNKASYPCNPYLVCYKNQTISISASDCRLKDAHHAINFQRIAWNFSIFNSLHKSAPTRRLRNISPMAPAVTCARPCYCYLQIAQVNSLFCFFLRESRFSAS